MNIYPFGSPGQMSPEGVVPSKIISLERSYVAVERAMSGLAPLAFRGVPSFPNPIYRDVIIYPTGTADLAYIRYGYSTSNDPYLMSPIYELGVDGATYNLRFSAGATYNNGYFPGLVYFDDNYDYAGYNFANANPRSVTGTVSSERKYVRLLVTPGRLMDSYIINVETGEYLFKGSEVNFADMLGKESFLNSAYWISDWGPNSRGDWIGWNFGTSDSASTNQRTNYAYPIFRQIGSAASSWSHCVSKMVALPTNGGSLDVEFSCGVADSSLMLRLLNPETGSASYSSAAELVNTSTVNTTSFTHVQLYFLKENYASCYIKDATNDVLLWEGASSLE